MNVESGITSNSSRSFSSGSTTWKHWLDNAHYDEINRLTVGVTGAAGLGAGAGAAAGAGFFLNILNIPPPTRIDIFKLEVEGNVAVLFTLLSWKRWRSAAGTPSHSAISSVNADAVTSDPTSKHLVLPDKSL